MCHSNKRRSVGWVSQRQSWAILLNRNVHHHHHHYHSFWISLHCFIWWPYSFYWLVSTISFVWFRWLIHVHFDLFFYFAFITMWKKLLEYFEFLFGTGCTFYRDGRLPSPQSYPPLQLMQPHCLSSCCILWQNAHITRSLLMGGPKWCCNWDISNYACPSPASHCPHPTCWPNSTGGMTPDGSAGELLGLATCECILADCFWWYDMFMIAVKCLKLPER